MMQPPRTPDSIIEPDCSGSPDCGGSVVERVRSPRQQYLVLAVTFLSWLFAGFQMSITPLVSQSATLDFLDSPQASVPRQTITTWFARYNAAFLFGAAAGGLLFGWIGDRFGRARALGLSVFCYSIFSAVAALTDSPEQFVLVRFIGCLGVGGTWPNAIALAGETCSDISKPLLAGIIGTAANVGLVLTGLLTCFVTVTSDDWRWVMLLGSSSAVIGISCFLTVPESPKWLASHSHGRQYDPRPIRDVLTPPLLTTTILGIVLGAIPLFGGWGCTNWLVPWADQYGAKTDPTLKAWTQVYRSAGAAVSSLLGGWVAAKIGARTAYFLFSLSSLLIGQFIYRALNPLDSHFAIWVFALGTTTGFYFGWLPLCLPEMFPTRVRATGSGVTFNSGRVLTGIGVLGAGYLSSLPSFGGDYAKVGSITSLVFLLGMIAIWLLPQRKEL